MNYIALISVLQETNYTENFEKLDDMIANLESEQFVIRSIDSWHVQFKSFLEGDDPNFDWSLLNDTTFHEKLSHFLFAPMGAKYRNMFKFDGTLHCGEPAPPILVSSIDFMHYGFESATQWVPALDK